jgi:hypothetical protein
LSGGEGTQKILCAYLAAADSAFLATRLYLGWN